MSSQPTDNLSSDKEVWPLRKAPYKSEPHYATGGFINGVEPGLIPAISDNGYIIPKPHYAAGGIVRGGDYPLIPIGPLEKDGVISGSQIDKMGSFTKGAIGVGDSDPVNHPKHYTSDKSGIECIQVTRWRNFDIGNAFKYLWRAGLKDEDASIQDLEKAIWYIQDEILRLKGLT